MARIILKSRYLRAGSKQHSEHLIQYIAKREGVQKIDDTWKHQPATKEQRKLIGELLRDFPEALLFPTLPQPLQLSKPRNL